MRPFRTELFDADVLAYRFGHAGVTDLDFGDGDDAVLVDPEIAVARALEHIEEITEECGGDEVILCWSDPEPYSNFRLDVDCTYKWKRTRADRPANYQAVRDLLSERFMEVTRPGLEADDVMGILQTAPEDSSIRRNTLSGGETVIVSIDKDMLQIPGMHFDPVKKTRRVVLPVDGAHLHMLQTLSGDPVDNYDGIPGIGPVKAEAILEPAGLDPALEWELVLRAYIESGQFSGIRNDHHDWYTTAVEQARLAKILQWEDYNMSTKEPILWQPPTR